MISHLIALLALGFGVSCQTNQPSITLSALHRRIYSFITTAAPCYRRLTAEGEIGCTANLEVGAIQNLTSQDAINTFATRASGGPFASVIPAKLMTLYERNCRLVPLTYS